MKTKVRRSSVDPKRCKMKIYQIPQKDYGKKVYEDLLKKMNADHLYIFRKDFNSKINKIFFLKIFPIESAEIF
jgi:hypothetical protein